MTSVPPERPTASIVEQVAAPKASQRSRIPRKRKHEGEAVSAVPAVPVAEAPAKKPRQRKPKAGTKALEVHEKKMSDYTKVCWIIILTIFLGTKTS